MADTHAAAAPGSHGAPPGSHGAPPGSHGVHAETHGGGGHATVKTYIVVAVVLAIITAIEVATLYVPGIPNVLLVTSLLIMSAIKFALVVGFFMHLKYDSNIMRSFFIGPLFIAICIILALMALFSAFILLPRPH